MNLTRQLTMARFFNFVFVEYIERYLQQQASQTLLATMSHSQLKTLLCCCVLTERRQKARQSTFHSSMTMGMI